MIGTKTTDFQDELLTEVDTNNKVIGSIARKIAHQSPDRFYRTVYVLVKDVNEKTLLQKRSPTKDLYPNCWDLSVGGHVNYGSSYLETAVREVKEELGLTVLNTDLKLIGEILVKLPTANEFFQIFEYRLKPDERIIIPKEEVSQIRWMTIEEIKRSISIRSLRWYPRPIQTIEKLY